MSHEIPTYSSDMPYEISLDTADLCLLQYAINTAIDHMEFLKTLHVNLPELRPEANTIGELIDLRNRIEANIE